VFLDAVAAARKDKLISASTKYAQHNTLNQRKPRNPHNPRKPLNPHDLYHQKPSQPSQPSQSSQYHSPLVLLGDGMSICMSGCLVRLHAAGVTVQQGERSISPA
jgi:hypothetical protein